MTVSREDAGVCTVDTQDGFVQRSYESKSTPNSDLGRDVQLSITSIPVIQKYFPLLLADFSQQFLVDVEKE